MIYLASNSPRRSELLQQIDISFSRVCGEIDEIRKENESATAYVQRLALEKAQQGFANILKNNSKIRPVLGADTIVVLDGYVFEKPKNQQDARDMMLQLSGKTHQVHTAVALVSENKISTTLVTTTVVFKTLNEDEISCYWQSGEPVGKAGGYGIQGKAAKFIRHLSGSYTGVVGLPLFETAELIANF